MFAIQAALALKATLVFEQEYHGIECDSASCAELYALLSCLWGLALNQGIAVTGAINQHGEVLPVGGINEKIEGFFRICATAGLTAGQHGMLIPQHNRRHLMLSADSSTAAESVLATRLVSKRQTTGLAPAGVFTSEAMRQVTCEAGRPGGRV